MKRISILVLVLWVCFVPVARCQQCSNNWSWSEFHNPNMKRWNPCEKVLKVNNVGELNLIWSYTMDGHVSSSPAVVNEVVYVGVGGNVWGNLYALNACTGALLWSFATNGEVSSPAVANGVVYFGSDSANGKLYALNTNGTELWSDDTIHWGSAPTVVNGVVYVSSNCTHCYTYALSARTGARLWKYYQGTAVSASPAVANGVVYVGCGGVCALNASTGALLWRSSYGSTQSSPAVEALGGLVFIGSEDGHLYALNATTGALLWSYATGGAVDSSPATNGLVYFGSEDGHVYALNGGTETGGTGTVGTLRWSSPIDFASSPAVANGVVYVGCGDFCALNAGTGALLWRYHTGSALDSPPAVANGVVYFDSGDAGSGHNDQNTLYAFALN